MTETQTVSEMRNWDLAEFSAERQQPTAMVNIYLNEYASHAKSQLVKAQSKASPKEVGEIDKKLAEVEIQIQASKYEIHFEAIPARMREDIHSKAMHEYPNKRNVLGQPSDEDPTVDRIKFENDLLWAACIRKLVTPSGKTFENPTKADVLALSEGMSSSACVLIDRTINGLHQDAERFTAESKNPDF
jgi:hypothetical protein